MKHMLPFFVFFAAVGLATTDVAAQSVPEHQIRNVLRQAKPRLHACYVEHVPLGARQGSGDTARLKLQIWHDGSVKLATFDDTTVQYPKATECMLEVAQSLKFHHEGTEASTVMVWLGLDSMIESFVVRLMETPKTRVTSDTIVKAANAKMAAFMACYTARLDEKPALQGLVKLELVVGRSGAIERVRVLEDTMQDSQATACMMGVARGLSFPAPGEDAPVIARIPLRFRTQ